MASKSDPPEELTSLKFEILKLSEKQMRRSIHSSFLNNCVEEGIIPSGLKLKLKIYIGSGGEEFQKSVDNLLDKVSLSICERLAEEQKKISLDIGKQMENARDKLKKKLDGHSLFDFDQEVYEKTESSKNSILVKQNKKLHKLRKNKGQNQLEKKNEAYYTMQKEQKKQQHSNNKHSNRNSNVKTASQQQRKDPPKQKSSKPNQITTLKNVTPTDVPKALTSKEREMKRNVLNLNKNSKDQQEQQKNWSPHGTIKKSYAEAVIMGESESVTMTKTLTHLVKVLEQLIQKTYQNKKPEDSRDLVVGDYGKKNKNGENKFREVKRQC